MRHNLDTTCPWPHHQVPSVMRVLAECTARHAALRSFHLQLHVFALCSAPEWDHVDRQQASDLLAILSTSQRQFPASDLYWLICTRRTQSPADCWMRLNVTVFQKLCTSFFHQVGPEPSCESATLAVCSASPRRGGQPLQGLLAYQVNAVSHLMVFALACQHGGTQKRVKDCTMGSECHLVPTGIVKLH